MSQNFIRLNHFGFRDYYAYLDSEEYKIVDLLQKYDVSLYPKKVMASKEYPKIAIVFAKSKKKDRETLEQTIFPELNRRLYLCEPDVYPSVLEKFGEVCSMAANGQ